MADATTGPIAPSPAPEAPAPSREGARAWLMNVARLREVVTFLICVAVIIIFHFKTLPQNPGDPTPSVFLSSSNIKAMLMSITTEGILVVGMAIVIVGGGFDISVGSVLALAGLVTVQALKAHVPLPVAMLLGLFTGAVCGGINGLLIARLGMSPLIACLGMMMTARALVTVHVHRFGAASSNDLPASFLNLGSANTFGLPGFWVVLIAFVTVLIGDALLRNLRWLRQIYYIGGNEKAAALSGINVPRVRAASYVICGVTAALAGILNSARFGTASYEAGMNVELQVIAECVIGGASLVGGQGTVLGAFLGVVLVWCIKTGLVQIGVDVDLQNIIVGVGVVFLVTIDIILARRRQGR
jgi:ribose transport system permease protein